MHLFRRRRPFLTAGAVLLIFLLASGSLWTWRWYQRQPKPHMVSAQVAPLPVTPLEKELKFPPLSIEFTESAARLEDLKNPALQHVRLDPAMPGTWKWTNDRKLAFTPAQDWPADNKYRIIFDKRLFPSHVRMDKLEYEVSTPPFRAEIKSVVLSEDAKEPGVQRIIATVNLTHAVDPANSISTQPTMVEVRMSWLTISPQFSTRRTAPSTGLPGLTIVLPAMKIGCE